MDKFTAFQATYDIVYVLGPNLSGLCTISRGASSLALLRATAVAEVEHEGAGIGEVIDGSGIDVY